MQENRIFGQMEFKIINLGIKLIVAFNGFPDLCYKDG